MLQAASVCLLPPSTWQVPPVHALANLEVEEVHHAISPRAKGRTLSLRVAIDCTSEARADQHLVMAPCLYISLIMYIRHYCISASLCSSVITVYPALPYIGLITVYPSLL